jgi:hypothetical protein
MPRLTPQFVPVPCIRRGLTRHDRRNFRSCFIRPIFCEVSKLCGVILEFCDDRRHRANAESVFFRNAKFASTNLAFNSSLLSLFDRIPLPSSIASRYFDSPAHALNACSFVFVFHHIKHGIARQG